MKLILASQSPRRKEILSMITHNFEVIVSNAEEKANQMLTVEEQVKQIAYQKAKAVFEQTKELGDRLVIGSDTIVVKDGIIYGKPKSKEEAMQMLQTLRGSKHEVMTALCIMKEKDGKVSEDIDIETTAVYIGEVNDNELEDWIATNEAYDKAGAYAIQGKFGAFIKKIEGDYYTVVGLPLHRLYQKIKDDIH